ncbi:cation diffusion facilitator family transporter [Lacunimicrobium album]
MSISEPSAQMLRHQKRPERTLIYRDAIRASWLGIVANLGLGLVKLISGIVGNSFALISDAFNSIGDAMTSIAVLSALKIAQRPADNEHPYGHTRAEAIAASNVAVVVFVSATLIGYEAIRRMMSTAPVEPLAGWTVLVAAANMIIKEGLFRYKMNVGKKTGSMSMIANAWDHRSDALCSLAVLIGLSILLIGGPQYAWAEKAAAIVVAVGIMYSSIHLYRASAAELMDPQASEEMVNEILKVAQQDPDVANVETLLVRKTGLEYLIDIHIEVDGSLTVKDGHDIGHRVKKSLLDAFPNVLDVLVHLEPHPHDHP